MQLYSLFVSNSDFEKDPFEMKFVNDIEDEQSLMEEGEVLFEEFKKEAPDYFNEVQEVLKSLPKEDVTVISRSY